MANHHNKHQNDGQVVVVIVPFLAQGHLNQLLHLSRLISSYDIPVHYVGTTTHIRQAKLRIHGWDPLSIDNIHFHEFPTPSFLSPPPNPNASSKFPSHLQPSFNASVQLRESVATVLSSLSPFARRIIVIHDSLMASTVQDVVLIPNAEAYTFQGCSIFLIYSSFCEILEKAFEFDPEIQLKDLPSMESCFSLEMIEFIDTLQEYRSFNSGTIYNSCREMEGKYVDLLAKEGFGGNKQHWAIGPFNPVPIYDKKNSNHSHKCLEWLDKQAPNSVIFVSFGTTTSLSDEQIQQLAIGLEQSEQKFIWVLRDADKGDVFIGDVRRIELPRGYEGRVEGKGMVVRDWAPQLEILGHTSTGGFISHCGWNSIMESISMGVPIATWPMHSDQPWNTILITNILKIGIAVRDWTNREELVTSVMVEKAVRRLMASEEGNEIRKRAVELGDTVKRSMEEGGASRTELNSFIRHITR